MIILKKKIKITILLIILLILYIYIANITLFPKNILLMQGERLNFINLWGIQIQEVGNSNPNIGEYKSGQLVVASSTTENSSLQEIGKIDLNLNLHHY